MSATITVNQLSDLLQKETDAVLLDVRTPAEYAQVHAVGTKLIPVDKVTLAAVQESGVVTTDKPVYIFCQSGTRAKLAAEKLAKEGLQNPVVVEGGTDAWVKAGLPVNRGKSGVIGLERQVRIAAGSFVLLGVILSFIIHPNFIGLSAFVGAGLVFAGITDWCGLGLLLAKAPWNQRAA